MNEKVIKRKATSGYCRHPIGCLKYHTWRYPRLPPILSETLVIMYTQSRGLLRQKLLKLLQRILVKYMFQKVTLLLHHNDVIAYQLVQIKVFSHTYYPSNVSLVFPMLFVRLVCYDALFLQFGRLPFCSHVYSIFFFVTEPILIPILQIYRRCAFLFLPLKVLLAILVCNSK